jgi:hypothetical protein
MSPQQVVVYLPITSFKVHLKASEHLVYHITANPDHRQFKASTSTGIRCEGQDWRSRKIHLLKSDYDGPSNGLTKPGVPFQDHGIARRAAGPSFRLTKGWGATPHVLGGYAEGCAIRIDPAGGSGDPRTGAALSERESALQAPCWCQAAPGEASACTQQALQGSMALGPCCDNAPLLHISTRRAGRVAAAKGG